MPEFGDIWWYGERGVLNALVVELILQDKCKDFLRSILWADGGTPQWIDAVVAWTPLVEHGFAQFGNPDLLFVCRTAESTHVIFVEAKVEPYLASARPNALGMIKGFNSRINGQLALRHRVSCALSNWSGSTDELKERERLHAAYARSPESGGLGDPLPGPRHLEKTSVLSIIRENGLHHQPLENYHLVALTPDGAPFWQLKVGDDLLPRFLGDDGKSAWETMTSRVGWTSYERIASHIKLNKAFHRALESMPSRRAAVAAEIAPLEEPAVAGDGQGFTVPRLNTQNRREFPGVRAVLGQIDLAAEASFPGRVTIGSGSTSIQCGGRVQVKIVPIHRDGEDRILLGLSPDLEPELWCAYDLTWPYRIGRGQNWQVFCCLELPRDEHEALQVAEEIFADVALRC